MTNVARMSHRTPVGRTGWVCVPCIVDRKVAELDHLEPLPEPREALAMFAGQTICYEHIQVQRQSPLAVPNGHQPNGLPPGTVPRGH